MYITPACTAYAYNLYRILQCIINDSFILSRSFCILCLCISTTFKTTLSIFALVALCSLYIIRIYIYIHIYIIRPKGGHFRVPSPPARLASQVGSCTSKLCRVIIEIEIEIESYKLYFHI